MKIFKFPQVILMCSQGREPLSSKDVTFSIFSSWDCAAVASGLRKGKVEPGSPPSGDPEPPLTIFLLPPPFSWYLGIRLRSTGPGAQTLRADGEIGRHQGAFHGDHVFPIKNWQVLFDLWETSRVSLKLWLSCNLDYKVSVMMPALAYPRHW